MTLPEALAESLRARFGASISTEAVGGGSISRAVKVVTGSGPIFVKFGENTPPGLFRSEADGLKALATAAVPDLRIPEVLACTDPMDGRPELRWLAMEWLEPGRATAEHGERLGRALAQLHRSAPGRAVWGGDPDGFIGSLPQDNGQVEGWPGFWVSRRLQPQLTAAVGAGAAVGAAGAWERLFAEMDRLLAPAEADGPSLLHGDLWSGNFLALADGVPALVDPSSYHGHREVDLAMSDLFGGFPARMAAAYREVWPVSDGYEQMRRGVYQLYYLLVHVNLFGGGYASQTERLLRQVLSVV